MTTQLEREVTAPAPAPAHDDGHDLESFGYKQTLRRTMSVYTSFALAFSMVSINTGIITLFSDPFAKVGGVAIWLWLLVIPGVFTIVLVYSHLAARLPVTGYAYQWSSRLAGPHLGWFTGWVALISFMAGTAAVSAGIGAVFAPEIWDNPTRGQVQFLSIAATLVVAALNIFGVRLATRVNDVGASIELGGVLLLIVALVAGLLFAFGDSNGLAILTDTTPVSGEPVTFTTLALAALLPVYVLLGWEGAADLAEETQDPRRTAPRAMIQAVAVSGAVGFVVFILLGAAIPGSTVAFFDRPDNPVFAILRLQIGELAGDVFVAVAFLSLFACLIANMAVATRMIFALSRDGMLPASPLLATVNARTRTPVAAILLVTALSVVLNFLNEGLVAKIFAIVGLTYYATYFLTMVATVIGNRAGRIPAGPAGVFGLGRRLVPMAILAMVWTGAVILVLSLPEINHETAVTTLIALALGFAWWLFVLRGRLARGEAGVPNREPVGAGHASTKIGFGSR